MDTSDTEPVTIVNKEYNINQDNVYKVKTPIHSQSQSLLKIENELSDDELLERISVTPESQLISQNKCDEDIEFFQCQRCSEYNILKKKTKARRSPRIRHLRVNEVTWQSFKRYAALNNVSMDYALMLLLYNAQTKNINYLINEKTLVTKKKNK